jgi:hypothetical protein
VRFVSKHSNVVNGQPHWSALRLCVTSRVTDVFVNRYMGDVPPKDILCKSLVSFFISCLSEADGFR